MIRNDSFDDHYDAVIVGARCAGAATAMLLACQGLKVLAIDRQAFGSDTLSTHALMRGGVLQLARWGVLDAVIAAGTPAVRRTSFHYGEECIDIDIRSGHGVDALYAPRRTVLDRALVGAARGSGAQICHGAVLEALDVAANGRVVGAILRAPDGASRTVRTPLVIGADGRHSAVARSVGAGNIRVSDWRSAAIYGYFAGLADNGFRWYYRPGVSVGAIPTNDGNTCVFVSLPPERFRREMSAGADALFSRILSETSGDFAAEVAQAKRQGGLRGFPGEAGYFRQSFGPGWALVGDAGYFKDPITAHGITDALRDAELLARAVIAGNDGALARYQHERDALSVDLFGVTDEIASFAWDICGLQDMHRRLNAAMKAETSAIAAFPAPLAIAA